MRRLIAGLRAKGLKKGSVSLVGAVAIGLAATAPAYSLTGALIIFGTILASVFGTASRIPYLAAPPKRAITLKGMATEVFHTLNNRSFISMALASMFVAVAVGARNGLEIYFGLYFWELRQSELATLATVSVNGNANQTDQSCYASQSHFHFCLLVISVENKTMQVHPTPV